MKYKKYVWLLIFIYQSIALSNVSAQFPEADSIISIIENTSDIEVKLKKTLELGDLLKGSNTDTAMFFYKSVVSNSREIKQNKKTKKYCTEAYLGIAEIFLYKGIYDSTLIYNSLAEELCKKYQLSNELAKVINMRGLVSFYQSNYSQALDHYNEAYKIARENNDENFMAKIFSNQAIVHFYQGNYVDAVSLFKEPVKIAQKNNNNELLAGSLMNLGLIFNKIGELDSALEYYTRSKVIYEKIYGIDGIVLCDENIASIHYLKSEYDKALLIYYELLELNTKNQNQVNLGIVNHNIADIYLHLGDYEQSMKYYLNAIEIRKKISDQRGLALSYKGLGQLHVKQKEYSEALSYFNRAAKIFNDLGYISGTAGIYMSIASTYFNTNELLKSQELYDSAQVIYEKTKDKVALSDLLTHKTSLYLYTKNYSKAKETANEALEIKKELEDKGGMALIYCYIAKIYYANNKYSDALDNALLGWKLAEETKILPTLVELSNILSKTYEKTNNNTLALNYAKKQISLKDSLYNEEKTKAMLMAEMRWQTKDKKEQIEKLEQEQQISALKLEKSESDKKRQKLLIYMLGIGLILSGLAIYLIIQAFKRKRELMFQKHLSNITQLRMQNIQNRISPHFFFNALSSAAIPLSNFPEQKLLFDKLVMLLRHSLMNVEKIAVPLSAEIEIIESYISIHQINKKGDFEYHRYLNLENIDGYQIPAMILQIPVENAIKHGLAPFEGKKVLSVTCNQNHNSLNFKVEDNGVGRKNTPPATKGTGSGLKLLMQTIYLLNQQNSEKIEFTINDADIDKQKGTIVEITIPKNYKYQFMN